MSFRNTRYAVVGVPTTAVVFLVATSLVVLSGCQPPVEVEVESTQEVESEESQPAGEEGVGSLEDRLMDPEELSARMGAVRSTITSAQVRHTFINHRERWVPCFAEAEEESPAVMVVFSVNPAGEVVDVRFEDGAQGESEVGRCLDQAVRETPFAVTSATENHELQFRFRPGAGQSPSRLSESNRR